MALARAQFARESKAIEEQLAAREIERASALARNIRSWAVLDLVPLAAKLQESVESARDAASHPFGAPKDGSPDRSEVESRVREVFSRGSAVFYDGGGVELEYRGAEDGFDQDSTVLLGKPPRAEGKGKASSLRLEGSSGPVLLVHRLPFVRPVSARVELTVPAKRAPGAVLAILAGAERERASGTGVTWTLAPSRLDARGLAPLPGGVGRLVPFEPGSAHALSLELGAPSEDGTVVLQGALDREPPGERASTDEGRLHGSFAIYVKDADVSLTLVRLSGVVDLPALARMKNDRKK